MSGSRETRKTHSIIPETIQRAWIDINSIDRIVSNKPYSIDNSVPCCFTCNSAKLDYTVDEFINQTKARALFCDIVSERISKFLKR